MEQERSWVVRTRVAWWAKFLAAVAAGVISLAGAARVLGLSVDVQSKTEARAQHEALKAELETRQDKALGRVEAAIDRLGDRIDTLMQQHARRPR